MDVLSDVVAVLRTGRPRSALVRHHAPWAQEFAPAPGSATLHVVLRGTCVLRPAATSRQGVDAGPGDVVLVPRGTRHVLADSAVTAVTAPPSEPHLAPAPAPAAGGGGPATLLLSCTYPLDPQRGHPLLAELPDLLHLPASPARHPEPAAAVRLLAGELERPRLGTDAVVPSLLDTLFLYVLRAWYDDAPLRHGGTPTGWAAALNDPPVAAGLHAMHRDPAAPWTVERLAQQAGLSRAAFARRFTALAGRPPLGYLTWWRMTLAARLLATSALPLTSVAAQVGYTSEFAFAHAFKRWCGMAPGRYRKVHGQ
ncbi:AraC family transcriptional regulator [Actinacidiphila bryophytorum]|uniref:AraC family transcriptional regulator n=1 Tax=Actinacidiphila bryophytorum TaxID=1436133 RepID=UPI002176C90A|nr:AraC family transcriptional regulator [Actinacidiphila bryophytorum]UWE09881.1 AraC family transcriptional regulator [Actinacidiphila bryophytorum]